MGNGQVVDFESLSTADLCVDATYRSGRSGNSGDDPLHRLLNVSLMGGFRYRGTLERLDFVVLTTNLADPDWPDNMDRETGIFTYYGDNKKPGRELHDTPRFGNEILRRVFADAHGTRAQRASVPPTFVFASLGEWRDMVFLGLAVPGVSDVRASEDLVAIWKVDHNRRFQNYRARFTILNEPRISRRWLKRLIAGESSSELAESTPPSWMRWVEAGARTPLASSRSIEHRRKAEQMPSTSEGRAIIEAIHRHFSLRPHEFEKCAVALARMMLPDIAGVDVTRPSRDGGRDATGRLRVGTGPGSILVEFALEAKCYAPGSAVGVREVSRLISRLRHRQFGILVTTSFVDSQAYREIKEDQHPIIVVSASDIVDLLKASGRGETSSVTSWLLSDFPAND